MSTHNPTSPWWSFPARHGLATKHPAIGHPSLLTHTRSIGLALVVLLAACLATSVLAFRQLQALSTGIFDSATRDIGRMIGSR